MAGRGRQKGGAMVMIIVQLCVVFLVMLWAGIFIGDWSRQREEQQNQADAVSIAAIQIARTQGIDAVCQHPAMQVLMAGNSRAPVTLEDCGSFVEVENPDGTTSLQFVANTEGALDTRNNPYLQLDDEYAIRTNGVSAIEQDAFDQAEQNLTQFVLVLDFSGSMQADFGGRPRYQVLQQTVTDLLNQDDPIEYGLVNYSADVLDSVGPGPNTRPEIINVVNRRGPDGLTNYQAAMDRATTLLRNTGSERLNLLFISDGQPTAGGDALEAARRAWDAGILIITLNIGGGAAQADLLRDMSGKPDDQGNADYAFSASNPQALREAFEAFRALALCTVGPVDVDVAPDENAADIQAKVTAVLRDNRGDELAMTKEPNLVDEAVANTLAYNFKPEEMMIYVTPEVCRRILEEDAEVIVRHGQLNLVQ